MEFIQPVAMLVVLLVVVGVHRMIDAAHDKELYQRLTGEKYNAFNR